MANKNNSGGNDMQMKIVVFAALIISFALGFFVASLRYKQQIALITRMSLDQSAALEQLKATYNRVTKNDDKMWVIKNGVTMPMESDTILSNGEKVTMDGKITKSDGSIVEMHNGDSVDMSGKMMQAAK